ncbi:MAG: hypothetical protein V7603_4753 [Micromonosporaceae bacterium]
MRYDMFLSKVKERGEYADAREAEDVTRAVLGLLARRLDAGEAGDLAAQLPDPAAAALTSRDGPAEAFGVREFLDRVARATNATEVTAQWDASAVLTTVAEAVSGGELNDVLTQLPSGYAALFGKTTLSG